MQLSNFLLEDSYEYLQVLQTIQKIRMWALRSFAPGIQSSEAPCTAQTVMNQIYEQLRRGRTSKKRIETNAA